jgi:hypothetical protein
VREWLKVAAMHGEENQQTVGKRGDNYIICKAKGPFAGWRSVWERSMEIVWITAARLLPPCSINGTMSKRGLH